MSWTESHPDQFGSYNLTNLRIDEAFANFSSTFPHDLWLYQLSSNCLMCPYKLVLSLPASGVNDTVRIISTTFSTKYRFRTSGNETLVPEDGDSRKFCDVTHNFKEFGVYEVTASGTPDDPQCQLNTLLEGVNIYLPILLVTLILIIAGLLIWLLYNYQKVVSKFTKKKPRNDSVTSHDLTDLTSIPSPIIQPSLSPTTTTNGSRRKRLRSLDTFRGICILLMIFVHDGGAQYWFMQHTAWDGLHVADVIFPWFLLVLGVCIPISLRSQLRKKMEKKRIILKILVRSLKIIILGLMLGTIGGQPTNLRTFRLFGVLQRLGFSYLVCSLLTLLCLKDKFQSEDYNHFVRNAKIVIGKWGIFLRHVKDITILWQGWLIILLLTILYTCLIFLLPVPSCPTGYLGPGGLHNNAGQPNFCIGGATGYVDRKVWGHNLLFQWPTANDVYNEDWKVPFDPEGTLGYLTSFLQCFLGVQLGLTFVFFDNSSVNMLGRLGIWTVSQGILGGFLCGWKQTGGLIPVNKNLWSISFVLVTNSMGGVLLGCLYIINDVWKLWKGSPLAELGMNSIFLYVIHLTVQKIFPWHWTWDDQMQKGHLFQLLEAMCPGLALWTGLAVWMKKKKLFVKL